MIPKKLAITPQEIVNSYNKIYATSGLAANSAYYRWVLKILQPKPGGKLLDVSCGEGKFLKEVIRSNRNIDAFGLDISDSAVAIAKTNCPQAKIIKADGQNIPYTDKFFDYITCLGSLEHYLDPELGIRELVRVAKDEAKFCIILPNSFAIDFILEVAKTGRKSAEDFQIIERTMTKKEWADLLRKNGLKIKKTAGSNLWPELFKEGTLKIKSIPKYLKRLLIKHLCPLNLSREFVFICERAVMD